MSRVAQNPPSRVQFCDCFAHVVLRLNRLVLILDAIGMGFFATSGAAIAVDAGASWFAAGLIGMLTAIAGGYCVTCSHAKSHW